MAGVLTLAVVMQCFLGCQVYAEELEGCEASEINLEVENTDSDILTIDADTDAVAIDAASGNGINGIIYELNGGVQNPKNPGVYNLDKKTKLYAPAKVGYKFGGWYKDETFTRSQKISGIKKGTQGDVRIYAKWIIRNYKIKYKLGKKAKNNPDNPKRYTVEDSEIVLKEPARKNYKFAGWYKDKKYTFPITSIDTSEAKSVTVYAKWIKFSQNVDYGNLASVREGELALINQYRASNGKEALSQNELLNAAAQVRAKEIAKKFEHTRPNGTPCYTAIDETGYAYWSAGENIAAGQNTVARVMEAWMKSTGHRNNILGNYADVGIGYYVSNGTKYWVQLFATPR